MTLSITWEGVTIAVSHEANWLITECDHIELRTGEKLPVTETGYRSHFIADTELSLFESLEDFVRRWPDAAAASKEWKKHLKDSQQLSLFECRRCDRCVRIVGRVETARTHDD